MAPTAPAPRRSEKREQAASQEEEDEAAIILERGDGDGRRVFAERRQLEAKKATEEERIGDGGDATECSLFQAAAGRLEEKPHTVSAKGI